MKNNRIKFLSIIIIFIVTACSSIKNISVEEHKSEIINFQNELNAEFKNEKETPLDKKDFINFTKLDFFPIDKKYRIIAKFIKNKNPEKFEFKTNTSRKPIYIKYGDAYFTLEGKKIHLEIYQNQANLKTEKYKDYLFLPFSDLTTGFESYGGGRYIDLRIPKEKNKILIDFNKAYNPYCAYAQRWSCPFIPPVNHLDIKINAGVKKFHP